MSPPYPESKTRSVYGTENSWCRAVPGGTGITVLSLLLKTRPNPVTIKTALLSLQTHHPILRSTLVSSPDNPTSFSLLIPPHPTIHLSTTSTTTATFNDIVENEMNINPWRQTNTNTNTDTMFAALYELDDKWVVVVKVHTGVCDRTGAVNLMRELMEIIRKGGIETEDEKDGEVGLGVEEYVPSDKANKPFWARGVNMLGYSLNSFRLSNLDFDRPDEDRCSKVVRFDLDSKNTSLLLEGCKSRGIKLCGAISAAGLIAARMAKGLSDGEWEKYAVVTLIDCRKHLEPPLSSHHIGFYHSGILNTHDMQGGEELWGLASRTYKSFEDAKDSNKHFTDMADLNFLMCKAIENPSLTPSSSLRTSFISVFEDPVIDEANDIYEELGVEDYMGCASVHGVGPSVAVFDTIRNGKLDCACVYPFPLHSREQMQDLIDNMKKILINGLSSEKE